MSTQALTPDQFMKSQGLTPDQFMAKQSRPDFARNPPGVPRPQVNMHESYLTGPTEDTPQPASSALLDFARSTAQGAADMSTPTVAHRLGQRFGAIDSQAPLYEGESSLEDIPRKAAMTMGPIIAGGIDSPEPTPNPNPVVRPPARSSGASILDHPGADLASELLPKPARMALKVGRLFTRKPGAPVADAGAPAIPETNGIPWGSGGDAPLDLRGKMIPPRVAQPNSARIPLWKQIEQQQSATAVDQEPVTQSPPSLVEQMGGEPVEAITEQPAAQDPEPAAKPAPKPRRRFTINDIPQDEWDAGHEIDTHVENQRIPPKGTIVVKGDESMVPALKKSLLKAMAAKAGRSAPAAASPVN